MFNSCLYKIISTSNLFPPKEIPSYIRNDKSNYFDKKRFVENLCQNARLAKTDQQKRTFVDTIKSTYSLLTDERLPKTAPKGSLAKMLFFTLQDLNSRPPQVKRSKNKRSKNNIKTNNPKNDRMDTNIEKQVYGNGGIELRLDESIARKYSLDETPSEYIDDTIRKIFSGLPQGKYSHDITLSGSYYANEESLLLDKTGKITIGRESPAYFDVTEPESRTQLKKIFFNLFSNTGRSPDSNIRVEIPGYIHNDQSNYRAKSNFVKFLCKKSNLAKSIEQKKALATIIETTYRRLTGHDLPEKAPETGSLSKELFFTHQNLQSSGSGPESDSKVINNKTLEGKNGKPKKKWIFYKKFPPFKKSRSRDPGPELAILESEKTDLITSQGKRK